MVTINNEDLKSIYHYLLTIDNVIQKEIRHVKGNKSHLDKMVPEQLSKVYSTKEKTALKFVDNLTRTAYDNAVIALCATFERIVFAKYRTTYGTLKNLIKTNAHKPFDYFDSREKFIYDSIQYLSGIISLLEGIIDNDLLNKLKTIKDHRNYIAHGKRDSAPPAFDYSIDEIASTLDDVVREIER